MYLCSVCALTSSTCKLSHVVALSLFLLRTCGSPLPLRTHTHTVSETLSGEALQYLQKVQHSAAFQKRAGIDKDWRRDGTAYLSSITDGIARRVNIFRKRPAEWYLKESQMKEAVEESLKIPLLSRNKIHYWLDYPAHSCSSLKTLSMDEVSRTMLGERRRKLGIARANGDLILVRDLALAESKIQGYIHESLEQMDEKGETTLIKKCAEGDGAAVVMLLTAGSDPGAASRSQKRAIHWAAISGMVDIVHQLCHFKANVNVQDQHAQTPIMHATKCQDLSVIQALIQHKADVNMKDDNGWIPVVAAACHGNDAIVRCLLYAKVDVNLGTTSQRNALHFAASSGHANVVKTLVTNGADIEADDRKKQKAIYKAVSGGHSDVMSVLINAKANLECKDYQGLTVMHVAVIQGHAKALQLLLRSQACPNPIDFQGVNPLMYATQMCESDNLLEMLIEANAGLDLHTQFDHRGETALHIAARKNQTKNMQVIFNKVSNVNIDMEDTTRKTPLAVACLCNSLDAVRFLISTKANIHARDKDGMFPLHHGICICWQRTLESTPMNAHADLCMYV